MNITLSIDERVAELARQAASSMGKSLNQAVRDYLEQLVGLGFWDSLIVQAARDSGCVQVLTEDLPGNALVAGVRIVNPFAAGAAPAPARAAVKARRR